MNLSQDQKLDLYALFALLGRNIDYTHDDFHRLHSVLKAKFMEDPETVETFVAALVEDNGEGPVLNALEILESQRKNEALVQRVRAFESEFNGGAGVKKTFWKRLFS